MTHCHELCRDPVARHTALPSPSSKPSALLAVDVRNGGISATPETKEKVGGAVIVSVMEKEHFAAVATSVLDGNPGFTCLGLPNS